MKPSREHIIFGVVLLVLVLATVVLWFMDPAHRPTGGSRIFWPGPAPSNR